MRDTLEHLVAGTLKRADFNKFLYILNQIDNAAREDNPEEVFAAWQRALAQKGLTAGRFYQIYDPASAVPIENEHLRRRFEAKRDHDMNEILGRIRQLEVERSYRVTGRLEQTAEAIRELVVPRLKAARRAWKRRVLWLDALVLGGLAALGVVLAAINGVFRDIGAVDDWFRANSIAGGLAVGAVIVAAWFVHRLLRGIAASAVQRQLERDASLGAYAPRVARAFNRNTRSSWPFLAARPVGWTRGARKRLDQVLSSAHAAIQELNDRYADPSGRSHVDGATATVAEASCRTDRNADCCSRSAACSRRGCRYRCRCRSRCPCRCRDATPSARRAALHGVARPLTRAQASFNLRRECPGLAGGTLLAAPRSIAPRPRRFPVSRIAEVHTDLSMMRFKVGQSSMSRCH